MPKRAHAGGHQLPGHDEDLPSPGATAAYSKSGCRATARLAGRVQGVVVQITTENRFYRPAREVGAEIVLQLELDVNGGRGFVGVFDFRLGQGGLAGGAPVDGFLAAQQALPFRANFQHSRAMVAS
jgi:hypothetical protein